MPKPPRGEAHWLSVYDDKHDGWRLRSKHASAGVLAQRADAMGL